MKVVVDFDVCASTGSCMHVCPEVFDLCSDDYLYILIEEPSESLADKIRYAADLCSTSDISLDE